MMTSELFRQYFYFAKEAISIPSISFKESFNKEGLQQAVKFYEL